MEYKLNKIDTELRDRVKEITSQGKIHSKAGIQIEKDKKQNDENKKFSLPKKNLKKNKKFVITAVKEDKDSISIDAFKEDSNSNINEIVEGNFLDVRK